MTRISENKIIQNKEKFDVLFPQYIKTIEKLQKKYKLSDGSKFNDLVNFITDERKRIMWPVAIAYWKHPNDIKALWEGIEKSIILAGITGQAKSPNAD